MLVHIIQKNLKSGQLHNALTANRKKSPQDSIPVSDNVIVQKALINFYKFLSNCARTNRITKE